MSEFKLEVKDSSFKKNLQGEPSSSASFIYLSGEADSELVSSDELESSEVLESWKKVDCKGEKAEGETFDNDVNNEIQCVLEDEIESSNSVSMMQQEIFADVIKSHTKLNNFRREEQKFSVLLMRPTSTEPVFEDVTSMELLCLVRNETFEHERKYASILGQEYKESPNQLRYRDVRSLHHDYSLYDGPSIISRRHSLILSLGTHSLPNSTKAHSVFPLSLP